MAPERQSLYEILPALPGDEETLVICSDLAFTNSPIRALIFPQQRKHLTTSDEFRKWRIETTAKSLSGEDGSICFKAVLKEKPGTIVGYAMFFPPGHFNKYKETVSGGSTAPPDAKAEDDALPASVDAEARRDLIKLLTSSREAIWGDSHDFWGKSTSRPGT